MHGVYGNAAYHTANLEDYEIVSYIRLSLLVIYVHFIVSFGGPCRVSCRWSHLAVALRSSESKAH